VFSVHLPKKLAPKVKDRRLHAGHILPHASRMPQLRLPRYERDPNTRAIYLTDRDHTIIRLVHRHRFLRSSQIGALICDSSQTLLRHLQLLYHHGYLERPRAQLEYFHKGGSKPMVYGLGRKGAKVLRKLGVPVPPVRWGEKNRAVGRIFLEHALAVSEVMVALELACKASGKVRLVFGEDLPQSTGRRSMRWRVNVGNVRLGLIPDHVFALEFPAYSRTPERAYFFLEADRGTMPVTRRNLLQTSFRRKLMAYEATWVQAIHRSRFGFHRFRVLTVTTSPERVVSLVTACGELKRGHGLFLFADRTMLDHSNLLYSHIWQSGQAGETASLLG
jgi:hypothetical protein